MTMINIPKKGSLIIKDAYIEAKDRLVLLKEELKTNYFYLARFEDEKQYTYFHHPEEIRRSIIAVKRNIEELTKEAELLNEYIEKVETIIQSNSRVDDDYSEYSFSSNF